MKNSLTLILLISCYLLLPQSVKAQDRPSLELSVSGIPLFDFNEGYFGFVANPALRYGLSDRFALGTSFFFYAINDIDVSGVESNARAYGVVPTLRYNWLTMNDTKIFLEGGVGFGSVNYKPSDTARDDRTLSLVERSNGGLLIYSLGPGIQHKLTSLLNLEVMIPYLRAENITDSNTDLYNGLGLTAGLSFSLR